MDRLMTFQHKAATRLFGEDVNRGDGVCRFAPEWLVLCINNFCNLKCRMCDVGIGERASVFYANMIGDDPGNMSLDLLKQHIFECRNGDVVSNRLRVWRRGHPLHARRLQPDGLEHRLQRPDLGFRDHHSQVPGLGQRGQRRSHELPARAGRSDGA